MNKQDYIDGAESALLHTYNRFPLVIDHGDGVYLYDTDGKEYLDATIRFSMSEFTTREEIDYTLETLYNCVPMLRRYTRH